MEEYVQIDIKVESVEQSDILLAQLSEFYYDAFEENENLLSAFIKNENYNERLLKQILEAQKLTYTKSIIKPVNWNQKWESEYSPVIVENIVAIRAFFHPPVTSVKVEIIITPKMSFGTGHHPTTFLMLQQMAEINFKNKTVLDFGTGTGVLAIYASKLGAGDITAIDCDDWSIENAKENFITNQCAIKLYKNNTPEMDRDFDIVLANINLNVIQHNTSVIKKISNASSQFIVSGILKSDQNNLIDEFEKQKIYVVKISEMDGWICLWLSN